MNDHVRSCSWLREWLGHSYWWRQQRHTGSWVTRVSKWVYRRNTDTGAGLINPLSRLTLLIDWLNRLPINLTVSISSRSRENPITLKGCDDKSTSIRNKLSVPLARFRVLRPTYPWSRVPVFFFIWTCTMGTHMFTGLVAKQCLQLHCFKAT